MSINKKLSILEYNQNLEKDHIVICYRGPFLDRVLAIIGEKINIVINKNPLLNKKIFSIFLELAQNVAYYSEEREEDANKQIGRGSFLITESESHYTIASANLIKKEWAQEVLEKSELINTLDTEGLRKLKRELRNQPRKENQIGGNIGLVDIALKAGSPLQVEITDVNDIHSYFIVSIDVPKQIN